MRLTRTIARGVRALFRSREINGEINDEVQHYVEQATNAYERQGLSPDAARRAAILEIGNGTVVREQVRSSGWEHAIETLIGDAHYALRRLRRNPAFTATAVATLALGIGASTTVFSTISPILLEPLPFPHADRLVTVEDRTVGGAPMPVTFGTFAELRARTRSFEAMAVADGWRPSLSGDGDPERLTGQRVSADYFAVYGASPAVGRAFTAADETSGTTPIVILSDAFLQRRFGGDRSIVGRTVDLDGIPFTVVGVLPSSFRNVIEPAADIWTPLRDRATGDFATREWGHHYQLIARLAPTASVDAATRELASIGRAQESAFPRPAWANLQQGLLVRSMQEFVAGPIRPTLLAIIGAMVLLLTIAVVNVTNLLLTRSAQRRSEFAMRAALGAGRGRIIRQLLTESIVLALIGNVLGLTLAYFGVRALVAAGPSQLPRADAIHISARALLFSVAVTTLVGIVVGLVPALNAARAESGLGLHQSSKRGVRTTTRSVLVIVEVAIALVLLVSAGLLFRSVTRLLSVPPGFDPSHVVTMQVVATGRGLDSNSSRLQFYRSALDAVRAVPGVTSAAFTSQLPLSGDIDGYGIEAQSVSTSTGGAGGSAMRYAITPDYFATMKIPLLKGRLLTEDDRPGSPMAVVINESQARTLFGTRNPLGERIRFGPQSNGAEWDYVVGVVPDVKHYSLAAGAPDAFYVASNQWVWVDNAQTLIVRATGDATALVPSIKRAIWSIDRNRPIVRIRTMESFVAASASARRFALLVIETFALAALVLAAVGLYGVIAGGVAERIREIGIRSALGAAPTDIVYSVLRRSLGLTGSGLIAGILVSLIATRLIQSMLFGIARVDIVTYAGVVGLLLLVAAAAAWAPARRAVGVDPTTALRSD
ncbi:MAG TPA: ABC transporter permease [Gemmatimonadaceae bacterium]|jgi:putative ABC transport system permease protein